MALIFEVPPEWPTPPDGWQPPPGWQPDPSWPPIPEGWRLWRRANAHPFGRAFGATTVLFLGAVAVTLAAPPAQVPTGVVIGRLLWVVLVLPALLVGTFAFLSSRRWGWGRYSAALLVALIFSQMLARASAAIAAGG